MEIERKFLIKALPENLSDYPCLEIEQGYLNTNPVLRIRKQNDQYFLTYKGKGMLAREEYNLPLNAESYAHLSTKCDGNIISKKRYLIPLNTPVFTDDCPEALMPESLTIELDVFNAPFAPLIMAEVEFATLEAAKAFMPPNWFSEDVTNNPEYHNSNMSRKVFD
ncbi:MAG: CYTH domain-containing protein [Lachnospiraceae bacterium]|nr:CYTH domain-containing protein [Lachnospiraceae bacterium]MBR3761183.1 CYTH domain-containing protein [Lachnospiraceae bacterium]